MTEKSTDDHDDDCNDDYDSNDGNFDNNDDKNDQFKRLLLGETSSQKLGRHALHRVRSV